MNILIEKSNIISKQAFEHISALNIKAEILSTQSQESKNEVSSPSELTINTNFNNNMINNNLISNKEIFPNIPSTEGTSLLRRLSISKSIAEASDLSAEISKLVEALELNNSNNKDDILPKAIAQNTEEIKSDSFSVKPEVVNSVFNLKTALKSLDSKEKQVTANLFEHFLMVGTDEIVAERVAYNIIDYEKEKALYNVNNNNNKKTRRWTIFGDNNNNQKPIESKKSTDSKSN